MPTRCTTDPRCTLDPRTHGHFLACADCERAYVSGEESTDRPGTEPALWALWTDDHCGWRFIEPAGHDDDGLVPFSRHACQACGSTVAGTRYPFVWIA